MQLGQLDAGGIQEVTLPVDGWQLFLDWEEQVPARWPNAGFANDSVSIVHIGAGELSQVQTRTNGWYKMQAQKPAYMMVLMKQSALQDLIQLVRLPF